MTLWDEGASTSNDIRNNLFNKLDEPALDLIAAVKRLHELSPQQLSKLIKDSGSNVVRHTAEDGSYMQIDVEYFARHLPLHFISVVMAWERDKSTFKYLLCGVVLLHALCDLATREHKIKLILLDDLKVSKQLINLVFYLLVVLGAPRKGNYHAPNDLVLLHSALVACSLKLLTVTISPENDVVAQLLTTHYKVGVFLDVTLVAICIDVKVLQVKLSADHADSSANVPPTNEETLIYLCQQCECSLSFIVSLCQQKLFQEHLVQIKELCGKGGILSLVQGVMSLKLSPSYSASCSYKSSVSRLKSKALSIILLLEEAKSASFLDEAVSTPGGLNSAKFIGLQVLELLKKSFNVDPRQLTAPSESIHPKGQLELNAMRLIDIFSDDSHFRSLVIMNFTEALATLFLVPHGVFCSSWCSSQIPLYDTTNLDVPSESFAHHITSYLVKVIANLHCFLPDVMKDGSKDLFLQKFLRILQKDPQPLSYGSSSSFDPQKSRTVYTNLCSLLSHAESLVPGFLLEDDVQLLRLFKGQFESLTASGDHEAQVARITGLHYSRIGTESAANNKNADVIMKNNSAENMGFREVGPFDVGGHNRMMDQGRPSGPSMNSRERAIEVSGSDSSPPDQMEVDGTGGSEENMEMNFDEIQQRKRKRPMMNDKQIAIVESALVGEPMMHRNLSSLKLWADKLSLHGDEVTPSRLKNWLNNRKAKLARCGGPTPPVKESNEVLATQQKARVEEGTGNSTQDEIRSSVLQFEPGQCVNLVGAKGEEIGKGKVFQINGKWNGRNLEEARMCVVDVIELSVDKLTELLHPMEVTGNSFDEAEKRLGLMRVLWDLNKLLKLAS